MVIQQRVGCSLALDCENAAMSDATMTSLLLWCGVASTALCLVALSTSRLYRVVPAFAFYLAFVVAVTILSGLTHSQEAYGRIYLITSVLDYLWELAVIAELASQIISFLRKDTYRDRKAAGLITGVAVAGTIALLVLSVPFSNMSPRFKALLQVDLAFDIFRVLFFAGMLLLALVLGMHWRHLPLKIVSCLSLYAAIALAARAVQEYADRLPSVSLWFRFADRGPILVWSAVMLIMSWQLVLLPKYVPMASTATHFIPWFRWLAKR